MKNCPHTAAGACTFCYEALQETVNKLEGRLNAALAAQKWSLYEWASLLARAETAEQWRVEVAEALGYLNRAEGQSGYEVASPRIVIAAFRRAEGERNDLAHKLIAKQQMLVAREGECSAARENHLKVMKERDAAYSLLDSFRNAHVQEHRWGAGVCHLCLAAEKLTTP